MDFWSDGLDRAPVMMNEVVLETDRFVVRKLWQWNIACAFPSHGEPGIVHCLLWCSPSNFNGFSAHIRETGERISSDMYRISGEFSCGRAPVCIDDQGFGYIDRDANLAIPPIYQSASIFNDGYAICMRDEIFRIVDTSGEETVLGPDIWNVEYAGQGVFRLYEHCEIEQAPDIELEDWFGRLCYVDAKGRQLTERDLIFALDFHAGIAIAARAEWKLTRKGTRGRTPRWSCRKVRWGAVDSEGRTVIPFVFDEIWAFDDEGKNGAYRAHFGGRKSGAWGVIDREGNWLAEPKFASIGDEYVRGCFTFSTGPEHDAPIGLYSVPEGRVVLPDIYDVIEMFETGDIWTQRSLSDEEDDEDDPEAMECCLFDASGAVKFDVSRYRWIAECDGHYEAHLADAPTVEVLDTDGHPLDSCDPIVFETEGTYYDSVYGLQDARGRVLIEPKYGELHPIGRGLYHASAGGEVGVIDEHGSVVIPMKYELVSISQDGTCICSANGDCAAYRIETRS